MTVRDAGGGNNIGGIQTNVDVPVGTQVVIGKSTPMNKQGAVKAVILVISGKILN
jgi:hypothetical protein